VERTLHDLRNDLAVAVAGMEALIDGKLAPTREHFTDVLASLEQIDAHLSALRSAARDAAAPGKENLLNAIIEGSPYAKVVVNQQGRITLINAQTELLFGYTRDELLGQSIELLVPERFRSHHPRLRETFNKDPVARPMGAGRDLYGRRKDGSEVPIEIGINPIATDAGSFTLATVTDITERKRAEELRLLHAGVQQHATELEGLNAQLASASRFKTQFVATMSHELRTPLNAIVGSAELLGRAELDERARANVQTINEAAEGLLTLINSILDFSKIEAGKIDLQSTPFLIEAVLESAADVSAHLGRRKGVTVHTYVDPLIPRVQGDPDRLRQILLNLMGNAVKFTDAGQVVARALPLRMTADEITVHFEVQDTGIGIDANVLPRLFEPFVQGDASASRKFGGTGLGLSISKRLVALMGGEIGVESEPNLGSLFWFTATFGRASEQTSAKRSLGGIGVLIVSRDETFAHIVEGYLTSWQMRSLRVSSRAEILESLPADTDTMWVAIVDADESHADVDELLRDERVIPPARIVTIGEGSAVRKPVRQSYLFDAIVKASGIRKPADVTTPAALSSAAQTAPLPGLLRRILIAEDNARLRRLLKFQFDELGIPVEFVADGLAAVEAVRHERYAMVFMDCQMPNMDGLSATRAIRAEEAKTDRHVPIVAMTANAFAEDRAACLAAGMDDYLAKPVRLADLRAAIERSWEKSTP